MKSICETWSPEQIIGRKFKNKLSYKVIYNCIYTGLIDISLTSLRRKGKSHKLKGKRGKFNTCKAISKRPKILKKRTEFGHWKLDTIVSSRDKSKGCMTTFSEMEIGMYIAINMPDRSQSSMFEKIKTLIRNLPSNCFKVLLLIEVRNLDAIKKWKMN